MLKDKLLGTWKLSSFTGTDESGETVHIMGADATGFICYSQDGWVSVQILRRNGRVMTSRIRSWAATSRPLPPPGNVCLRRTFRS
jgi:hypothetical protein